ncbi:MAG: hypothetical protein HY011_09135 [Acidobacteria bacterium]|nr:hypothetical protein [Acidobacteriota bacterium]
MNIEVFDYVATNAADQTTLRTETPKLIADLKKAAKVSQAHVLASDSGGTLRVLVVFHKTDPKALDARPWPTLAALLKKDSEKFQLNAALGDDAK